MKVPFEKLKESVDILADRLFPEGIIPSDIFPDKIRRPNRSSRFMSDEERKNLSREEYQRIKNLRQKADYKAKKPWAKFFKNIQQRCINKKHLRYKYYGGKGIKYSLTIADLEYLWFRDKAYEMKRPSIDRLDSNKDYTKDNCQFLELSINCNKK